MEPNEKEIAALQGFWLDPAQARAMKVLIASSLVKANVDIKVTDMAAFMAIMDDELSVDEDDTDPDSPA